MSDEWDCFIDNNISTKEFSEEFLFISAVDFGASVGVKTGIVH
jgi:hypothetical protein